MSKPTRKAFWSEDPHAMRAFPKLLVIRVMVTTGQVFTTQLPYYISKNGRYIFRFGPGLFNGMKESSFGQFNYCRSDGVSDYAEMVFRTDALKHLEHFMKCLARIKQRKEILQQHKGQNPCRSIEI